MTKLIALFNQRQHFKNRLKLRNGKLIYLLLAKLVEVKKAGREETLSCYVYQYKNHRYYIQDYKLQTYVNAS